MNRVKHHGRVSAKLGQDERRDYQDKIFRLEKRVLELERSLSLTASAAKQADERATQSAIEARSLKIHLEQIKQVRGGLLVGPPSDEITPYIKITAQLTCSSHTLFGDDAERRHERLAKAIPIIDVAFASQMRMVCKTVSEVCPGIAVQGSLDWETGSQDWETGAKISFEGG